MTSRSRRQTRRLPIGHPDVVDPVEHNTIVAMSLAERRFVRAVIADRGVGRGFARDIVRRALEMRAARARR